MLLYRGIEISANSSAVTLANALDLIALAQPLDVQIVAAQKTALDGNDVTIGRFAKARIGGIAIDLAPPLAIVQGDREIAAFGKGHLLHPRHQPARSACRPARPPGKAFLAEGGGRAGAVAAAGTTG